jgi:hypothetical protein
MTQPDTATIAAVATANAGSTWLLGNEIDRRDWCGSWSGTTCTSTGHQGEILPSVYARAYHDLYNVIKAADPTAKVAIGGMIEATPLRLQYLTMIWDSYVSQYGVGMPADLWNVHAHILREPNDNNAWGAGIPPGLPDDSIGYQDEGIHHFDMVIFDRNIRAFRQWMKDHGQQDKDLLISEYGVLLSHMAFMNDPATVQAFMNNTYEYFTYTRDCNVGSRLDGCRLVQSWAWYSLDDNNYNRYSKLFDPTSKNITNMGVAYRDFVNQNLSQLRR